MRRVILLWAALVVAVAVAAVGAGFTSSSEAGDPMRAVAVSPIVDPPDFLLVRSVDSGIGERVEFRSPVTGELVSALGPFGASFTNNGLEQSPDGSRVYLTFTGSHTLKIERINVATRSRTFVANGERPSLSPGGTQLAYAAGPFGSEALAVRDLSSGATRTIDLRRFLGRSFDLTAGLISWLGDESSVVAVPIPAPVPVQATETISRRAPGACGPDLPRTCLIVVRVGRPGRPLTAYRLRVRGLPRAPVGIQSDGARARSLYVTASTGSGSIVERIDLAGTRGKLVRLFTMPDALPLVFDRRGQQLLYLVGHTSPALWTANVARGEPTDQRLLMPGAKLQAAAW